MTAKVGFHLSPGRYSSVVCRAETETLNPAMKLRRCRELNNHHPNFAASYRKWGLRQTCSTRSESASGMRLMKFLMNESKIETRAYSWPTVSSTSTIEGYQKPRANSLRHRLDIKNKNAKKADRNENCFTKPPNGLNPATRIPEAKTSKREPR